MIVRVLGEGQYELDKAAASRVEALDADLEAALAANDEGRFSATLGELLSVVRGHGRPVDSATIVPSDLAVPSEGSSLEEVRALLAEGTPEPA